MTSITWSADQLTGNILMDNDHLKMVAKLNTLLRLIDLNYGQPSNSMRAALDDLFAFTREHFDREEVEMLRINYTDSKTHRAEHLALLAELIEFRKALNSRERISAIGVQSFLGKWLCDHILREDMKLAAALKNAGVAAPLQVPLPESV